jgi:hypothetical protein
MQSGVSISIILCFSLCGLQSSPRTKPVFLPTTFVGSAQLYYMLLSSFDAKLEVDFFSIVNPALICSM